MSNPNNLIRPPVLPSNLPHPNPQPPQNQDNRDMVRQIADVVNSILNDRLTARNVIEVDEPINVGANGIGELDKIPDIVRSLRDFAGDPGEFGSWKKSVERIIQLYEPIRGSHKYFGILNIIRNKITGQADIVLESYNTPLNWAAISRCLTTHYGDKRDLGTLEYQMSSLTQGNLTIHEYYQKVYSNLSLILNNISCLEAGAESRKLLVDTYRNKALDTFVRGLNGDLPRLLGIREPADLPEALQLCLKLENQTYRANIANRHNYRKPPGNVQKDLPSQHHAAPKRFYPHLAHWNQPMQRQMPLPSYNHPQQKEYWQRPQHFFPQQQSFNYQLRHQAPPRPFAPKPMPRPEPMDVDQSMQSRRVNYMNRPPQNLAFQGKRPPPPHQNIEKRQRNFNIEAEQCKNVAHQQYLEYGKQHDEIGSNNYDIQENLEHYGADDNPIEDFSDIHFLG